MMGCSPGDNECADDEKPAHQITISRSFWMGKTEVTEAAYNRVTGDPGGSGTLPKVEVTWNEAGAYCAQVGLRLPTEAEWEYAARAGTTGSRYGPLDEIAWYYDNSGRRLHPVGQKKPNDWGLHDMLGNAWEWVRDSYDEAYYRQSPSVDPVAPPTGKSRTMRGASWSNLPVVARVSYRLKFGPAYRYINLGFRCAGELR